MPGIRFADAPDRIVDRTRDDGIHAVADHRVEASDRPRPRALRPAAPAPTSRRRRRRALPPAGVALVQHQFDGRAAAHLHIPRLRDLSVAVGIDHLAAPAHRGLLRLVLVLGLGERRVVDLRVDPAEHRPAQLVEVHGLVGVVVELQMVRAVAGFDQLPLRRLRIVERGLTAAVAQRVPVGELVSELRIVAPGGLLVAADLRRRPDAALAVHHRVVRIRGVVRRVRPQMLVAPVQRRERRRREPRRHLGLRRARRDVHRVGAVLLRIQHHQLTVTGRHGIDRPAAVDGRVVLVRRDLVVHERVVVTDIPQRHDDVALDTSRSRRRRRHLALGDAIGPVRQHIQRPRRAHRAERPVHRVAAHAALQPAIPRLERRLHRRVALVDIVERARQLVAELMTEVAARLQRVDPVVLRQHRRAEPVAGVAGARETTLPPAAPSATASSCRDRPSPLPAASSRRSRAAWWRVASASHHRRRIDQAVAAHPHAVVGGRQFGQHEAALIVGDDDLDQLRRQFLGFGDDPDAGLRALLALDDAADVARAAACPCTTLAGNDRNPTPTMTARK